MMRQSYMYVARLVTLFRPMSARPQTLGSVIPDAMSYASPEVKKNGWSVLKE